MSNLCCQIHPVWLCKRCGWKICNLHWIGSSIHLHSQESLGCTASDEWYRGISNKSGNYDFGPVYAK